MKQNKLLLSSLILVSSFLFLVSPAKAQVISLTAPALKRTLLPLLATLLSPMTKVLQFNLTARPPAKIAGPHQTGFKFPLPDLLFNQVKPKS